MNLKRTVFSILIVSILVAGCTTTRVALDYTPLSSPSAALQSRPLVVVGRFADNRGEPANWLGAIHGGYGNPLKNLEASQPVSDLVAKAFADGLRARGLLAEGDRPYVLSGVIRRLDCNQYVRQEANADLQVVLTEATSGRELFSQSYKKENVEGSLLSLKTGIFASVEDLRALTAKTLQQVVDAALDDPALRNALR
ncbi:MAG: YajG family lipoprotein [Gammaproteobacteria bacterium]